MSGVKPDLQNCRHGLDRQAVPLLTVAPNFHKGQAALLQRFAPKLTAPGATGGIRKTALRIG